MTERERRAVLHVHPGVSSWAKVLDRARIAHYMFTAG